MFNPKFDICDYNYKDCNQSTMMITITIPGASVQEAIDLEREVLREEDRRGPAVRWVLDCFYLSLFCNSLSLQGE